MKGIIVSDWYHSFPLLLECPLRPVSKFVIGIGTVIKVLYFWFTSSSPAKPPPQKKSLVPAPTIQKELSLSVIRAYREQVSRDAFSAIRCPSNRTSPESLLWRTLWMESGCFYTVSRMKNNLLNPRCHTAENERFVLFPQIFSCLLPTVRGTFLLEQEIVLSFGCIMCGN